MPRTPDIDIRPDPGTPSLITPRAQASPALDLTTRPEDCPDLPEGEWSQPHLHAMLSRQPRVPVYIPLEGYERDGEDSFAVIGYMGHFFTIRRGYPEMVPVQIASIVQQSQDPFPTTQSRQSRRQITDIRQLAPNPNARGLGGPEIPLG